jgi:hypothetical protein
MLVLVRIALPLAIAIAGLVLLLAGGSEATRGLGLALVLTAGLVVFANVLLRFGLTSGRDRDVEARARERFRRTGRWS